MANIMDVFFCFIIIIIIYFVFSSRRIDFSKRPFRRHFQLSRSVWHKYSDNRQSAAVYDTKMAMWRTLSALIKSRWPGCGLYMVGSTMNGFGGDVSDADFCLLTGCPSAAVANGGGGGSQLHRTADELHRACGVQRLRWLVTMLDDERPNRTADVRIVYAKVPILRFRWISGGGGRDGDGDDRDGDGAMDADLSCNNVVGIRNTHLLYCYSRRECRPCAGKIIPRKTIPSGV